MASDTSSGAAPAAAEPAPAPVAEAEVAAPPNPIDVQAQPEPAKPEVKAEPVKPKQTARDALDKAEAKVTAAALKAEKEANAAPVKTADTKAKPAEAKPEIARTEHGHFAPKVPAEGETPVSEQPKPTAFRDAPSRFSADAKTAWETAPEPVKAEVHRMQRELEAGLSDYRKNAEELKPYDDLAKQNNTTVKDTLKNYVELRDLLGKSPVAGLERIVNNIGLKRADGTPVTLRDIAGYVLNQKPDQVASRQEGEVAQLRQTIASLEQKIGGVTKTIEQQQSEQVTGHVQAFAEQPGHERFDELADDIRFFLTSGKTTDLHEAYTLAERLNPAPAGASREPVIPAKPTDPAAQTRNGSKSITGAPSSGSSPAKGKPSTNSRSALDKAFARVGL